MQRRCIVLLRDGREQIPDPRTIGRERVGVRDTRQHNWPVDPPQGSLLVGHDVHRLIDDQEIEFTAGGLPSPVLQLEQPGEMQELVVQRDVHGPWN